jgi:signal transduction histidine kinase
MFIGLGAVALENSRLHQKRQAKAEALAALNKDLEAAVHAKTRFFPTVSNDLRSTLVVVTGYANLIIDGNFGPLAPGISASVQKIIKQGNHISMLITNLLETAQLDAVQGEPSLWPFDVREILDEVVQIVPGLIDDKPIVFECDYDRDFPLVVTNREKLKQVLGYLLDNAVKFTEQGKIVPGASSCPEAVSFGSKIPALASKRLILECILDGFRQVDDENQRRYGGLGLGLYLSR